MSQTSGVSSGVSLGISSQKVALPGATGAWKFSARPGGWWVAQGPGGERRRVMLVEARGKLGVCVGGRLWQCDVVQARRGSAEADDGGLVAQFPGKVRKLLVAAGVRVEAGEALVLVEAMKMEFAVKAPSAGVVKRVLVKEGQQLSPGDAFVEFEALGDG